MIGRMRHRLTLEAPVESDDGAGGRSLAWTAIATVWGAIEEVSGQEAAPEEAEIELRRLRITVRASVEIRASRRFVAGDRIIDILGVRDAEGRGRYLLCDCRERRG